MPRLRMKIAFLPFPLILTPIHPPLQEGSTRMKKKNIIQLVIGVLVSVIGIYFAFRGVGDWSTIGSAILGIFSSPAQTFFFILSIVLLNGALFVRAFRWRFFITAPSRIRFSTLSLATFIGYLGSCILPFKLGEVARAYVVGHRDNVKKSSILASVVLERVIDGFSIVFIFLILTFTITGLNDRFKAEVSASNESTLETDEEAPAVETAPQETKGGGLQFGLQVGAIALFAVSALALVFLILLRVQYRKMMNIVNWFLKLLPEKIAKTIGRFIKNFTKGIGVSSHPYSILAILGSSLVYWAVITGGLIALFYAFPSEFFAGQNLFVTATLVLTLTAVGLAIPALPGSIGTFDFMAMTALAISGTPKAYAAPYVLVYHYVTNFLAQIVFGFIALLLSGMNLKQITKREDAPDDAPSENETATNAP